MANSHAIIFTQSPFQNQLGQDGLELALTLATFEQAVSLFFRDTGVLQLLSQLDGTHLGRKTYTDAFKSLDLYDIEDVFVCQDSLALLNIDPLQLNIPVSLLNQKQWSAELAKHNRILTF